MTLPQVGAALNDKLTRSAYSRSSFHVSRVALPRATNHRTDKVKNLAGAKFTLEGDSGLRLSFTIMLHSATGRVWIFSALLASVFVSASRCKKSYTPKLFGLGTNATIDGLRKYSSRPITLDASSPVLTLDYGNVVGGWPFVEVDKPESAVQIELKYSEPFVGLALPQGDGPWYALHPAQCHLS